MDEWLFDMLLYNIWPSINNKNMLRAKILRVEPSLNSFVALSKPFHSS